MKHVVHKHALGASLALAAAVAALAPAHSATTRDGSKGSDATECASQVREYKAGTPNAMMVRGWMAGNTSAVNLPSPEFFNRVPWHDLNTVASFIAGQCAKKPKPGFAQAVSGLTSALGHKYLKTASRAITRMARALAAKVR